MQYSGGVLPIHNTCNARRIRASFKDFLNGGANYKKGLIKLRHERGKSGELKNFGGSGGPSPRKIFEFLSSPGWFPAISVWFSLIFRIKGRLLEGQNPLLGGQRRGWRGFVPPPPPTVYMLKEALRRMYVDWLLSTRTKYQAQRLNTILQTYLVICPCIS